MIAGAAGALALFLLAGSAAMRLVGRGSRFLLGLGSVGSLLFIAAVAHCSIVVSMVLIAVASIAILLVTPPLRALRNAAPSPLAASLVMIVALLAMAISAVGSRLHDYDGRVFWMLKAKAIAHERSVDGPFFHGQMLHAARNHYPLLMPFDDAVAMILGRTFDDRVARWIYVFALGALAFESRRRMARHFSATTAAWLAALLVWIPQIAGPEDGSALSAYNDVIIAAFAGCALFDLMDGDSPGRFGLWLAFLTLTKNEGLPYALVLLAAGVFVFRWRLRFAWIPMATAAMTLSIWRRRIPLIDEEDYPSRFLSLGERLGRIGPALRAMVRHPFILGNWGFFWIGVALALLTIAVRGEWRRIAVPLSIFGAMTGIYLAAYLVSSWIVQDLVNASAPRLLTQLIVPALWIIGASERNR